MKSEKMRLGIDIDDVLLGLMTELTKFYNEKHGTDFTRDSYLVYNLSSTFKSTSEEAIYEVKCFYESPYFDKMIPLKGAVESISKLQEKYDIIVITSRPEYMKEKTIFSINKYFPGLLNEDNSNLFLPSDWHDPNFSKSKADVCLENNIDIMIDDRLKYVVECANKGITSILFDAPWNKFKQIIQYSPNYDKHKDYSVSEQEQLYLEAFEVIPTNITRMYSWKEIFENLMNL